MELFQCVVMQTRSQEGDSPSNKVRWSEVVGLDLDRWAWRKGKGVLELNLKGYLFPHLRGGVLLSQFQLKIGKGVLANMTLVLH